MKKIFLISIVSLLFAVACSDDDKDAGVTDILSWSVEGTGVTPKKSYDDNWVAIVSPGFGGTFTIKITTSAKWEIELDYLTGEVGWLAVSDYFGTGSKSITVAVDENKKMEFRKANITVKAEGTSKRSFAISQTDSEPVVEFIPESGGVSYDSGNRELLLSSYNGEEVRFSFAGQNINDFDLTIIPPDERDMPGSRGFVKERIDWITDFSFDGEIVTFTTLPNFSGEPRQALIRLEADNFEDFYALTQSASLYRNILISVDDNSSPEVLSDYVSGIAGRDIEIKFESDVELAALLSDVSESGGSTNWIKVKRVADGIVTLELANNTEGEARSATLVVKAADSKYGEQNPLTWGITQTEEILIVELASMALDENTLVFSPTSGYDENNKISVASFTTSESELTLNVTDMTGDWVSFSVEGNKIYMSLDEYSGGSQERTAKLNVRNSNGFINRVITVKQAHTVDIAPKSSWSIGFGNDHTTEQPNNRMGNMIDNNTSTVWEWYWNEPEPKTAEFPYEFIIDFGSEEIFNSFDVWQDWRGCNSPVKDVIFAASNDRVDWIHMGQYVVSTSVAECVAHGDNPYSFTADRTVQARYLRFSILNNTGGPGVNYYMNAKVAEISVFLK